MKAINPFTTLLLATGILLGLTSCTTKPLEVTEVIGPINELAESPFDGPAWIEIDPGSQDLVMSNAMGTGVIRRDGYAFATEAAQEVFSRVFPTVETKLPASGGEAYWKLLVRYELKYRFLSSKIVADVRIAAYPPGEGTPLPIYAAEGGQTHHIGALEPTIRNAFLRAYATIANEMVKTDR